MRIRRTRSSDESSFWAKTRRWVASRCGLKQFALAVLVGMILAGGLGFWYVKTGQAWIATLTAPLRAEAQKTVEEVTVTNDLPTLYFDIGFAEFQAMATQREEALQKGILLQDDDDWARAEIRFQGETIPVRLRLKGDWTDHLNDKKWSFRVKTRGDATLLGMRSFSVQAPYTRSYLNEWLYYEDLRQAGILAPRYSFVNVVVNGESWGIYALEENFSKELLEAQGRREGVIIRFDESLFWERRAQLMGVPDGGIGVFGADPITRGFETPEFALVDEFNTAKIATDPVLEEQSRAALGLLRGFQSQSLTTSQVFDTDLLGRYLAHANLWSARHGTAWHNVRYYYNPLTSRLEPIAYDALALCQDYVGLLDLDRYDDPAVMQAYAHETQRISQPEYLDSLKATYGGEFERYRSILLQEFPEDELVPPWEALAKRQTLLQVALHPPQSVYAYQLAEPAAAAVEIQVGNILHYPVVLTQLQVEERTVDIHPDWITEKDSELLVPNVDSAVILRSAHATVPQYVTLRIPAAMLQSLLPAGTTLYSNTLQLVTNLYGVTETTVVDVLPKYPPILSTRLTPTQPSVAEALQRYPFLSLAETPDFLMLRPGNWAVAGDLVLPDGVGLQATQSVSLTFEPGALFFANGPLLLSAPDDGGIYLGPQGKSWAGLVILQTGESRLSELRNVEIRGTTGIDREGWMTTGGVTFYESPVTLENCRILDSAAEDALNIVRTDFELVNAEFGHLASDAFDGDFVQGEIKNCAFHDIRGDGVDLSGSHVWIKSVNLLRIYDKGVSVGEGSTVSAENIYAREVTLAIVSKDLSQVTVDRLVLSRVRIAGLAAYQKKMEYGPAHITATNVEVRDMSPSALVQKGSGIRINGNYAPTVELSIADFYDRLEALAQMRSLDYALGTAIKLQGFTLLTPEVHPGGTLRLSLYWQAESTPALNYTVFIHINDEAGSLVAQQDVMPAEDTAPTSRWEPGEFVEDFHIIPLPEDLPSGEYHILVGMYDFQTGARLPVTTPEGEELPDAALWLPETFGVVE